MDFLEEELEEILNIFRAESEEHIQKINQCLLKLEANPEDGEIIAELFREAHSVKGAARMIELTDIQTLAHKIEDIFGLARDGLLRITPEIVDVLCSSVDCISSIIEESILTRGQSHSSEVDVMMEKLVQIEKNASPKEEKQEIIEAPTVFSPEVINKFCMSTVSLIQPIRDCIEKLKSASIDSDSIKELHKLITEVWDHSQDLNFFELKEPVQDIKIKLDGVVKGSGMLLEVEVSEIEESFDKFIKYFDTLMEKVDTTAISQSLIEESPQLSTEEKEDVQSDISCSDNISDFDGISNNIAALAKPSSSAILNTLSIELTSLISTIKENNIRKIVEKIQEIVTFAAQAEIHTTQDIALAIKDSFDSAIKMINSPNTSSEEDPTLIFQRLTILQQMIKISSQESSINDENNVSEQESAQQFNYSPAPQNTEIFKKPEVQPEENSNNSKISEDTTIKTLRVDTRKLDQLVSQVGELIIAKIKAKETLSEIEKITRSVEDLYKEWGKTKQTIKYLDKKPLKSSDLPAGTSIYSQNKSVSTFLEESAGKLSTFMNQMNSLYRITQENDARLDLVVNELEERIKSIRVLPLATIFHMFPRMTRDIARERGKEIDLIISGSETSVDKKIIEEIKSPLMHIIRNSIDHGVEKPDERVAKGKNPTGKIILSAYHLENSVLIEVIDDGKGIDLEKIKEKVLQKGLLTQAELQAMNDNQIMNIIFWPGFSTGDAVTDISGRGVGLDVVHNKINQLNGKVSVKSTFGEGCKVSIQLPITMATVKSFLVKVKNQTYAIPTSAIKTALLIKSNEIFYKEGRETIIVDNKTVPVCRLSKVLEIEDYTIPPEKIIVIVIQAEDVQVGFIIDKLIGDQEILHKNLTPPLLRVKNVAGVTTLASGELCLILNVNDLVKSAYSNFGMSQKQLIINKENNTAIAKKNVLVVDDSITTRILERNILKAAGYNVTVAVNGLDALTKLASEQFDLVVSDVEMPEINGFELTERVKSDEKLKKIPIILVTSLASESDKRKGLSLGANAYITKGGFSQENLLSTIRKLLSP